jgi:hypothetical protein
MTTAGSSASLLPEGDAACHGWPWERAHERGTKKLNKRSKKSSDELKRLSKKLKRSNDKLKKSLIIRGSLILSPSTVPAHSNRTALAGPSCPTNTPIENPSVRTQRVWRCDAVRTEECCVRVWMEQVEGRIRFVCGQSRLKEQVRR